MPGWESRARKVKVSVSSSGRAAFARAVGIFLLTLCAVSCTPQRPASSPLPPPPPPPPPSPPAVSTVSYERVIVLAATQNRAQDASAGRGAGYAADDVAAEIVTAQLLQQNYRMVERRALNAILRKQGLQQSSRVDQATAVRVGQLAGAGAIIIASVENANTDSPQGFQGDTNNPSTDAAGTALNPGSTTYRVDMTVKMIDTQTAAVVWSEEKSLQSPAGAQTSHLQLLQELVAWLSFPRNTAASPPTPPPSKPAPDPQVRQVQKLLLEQGYDPGRSDGRIGKKTREALRQFQRARNLPETGKIDKATKDALQQSSTSATEPPQQPPASSSPPPPTEPLPPQKNIY